jgi:hypothetical protein
MELRTQKNAERRFFVADGQDTGLFAQESRNFKKQSKKTC